MFKNPGTKWPIIIAVSTLMVIGFSIVTIKTAINNPVEMSDYGMQGYHAYDNDANDIINAKIAFDKKYAVTLVTSQILENNTTLIYQVTDKEGNPVNDAKIEAVLTRPYTTKEDVNLSNPAVENGQYTFASVSLPKPGRWDILAKISVGAGQRYYNIKADTRNSKMSEF